MSDDWYMRQVERLDMQAKMWRTFSIFWFCMTIICFAAFWLEVWRHANG